MAEGGRLRKRDVHQQILFISLPAAFILRPPRCLYTTTNICANCYSLHAPDRFGPPGSYMGYSIVQWSFLRINLEFLFRGQGFSAETAQTSMENYTRTWVLPPAVWGDEGFTQPAVSGEPGGPVRSLFPVPGDTAGGASTTTGLQGGDDNDNQEDDNQEDDNAGSDNDPNNTNQEDDNAVNENDPDNATAQVDDNAGNDSALDSTAADMAAFRQWQRVKIAEEKRKRELATNGGHDGRKVPSSSNISNRAVRAAAVAAASSSSSRRRRRRSGTA